MDDDADHEYADLGAIRQSPLDPNKYKLIQLCKTGLKCLLISTSERVPSKEAVDDDTCVYRSVQLFNEKYIWKSPILPDLIPPRLFEDRKEKKKKKTKKKKSNESSNSEEPYDEDKDLVYINYLVGSGSMHDPADVQGMAHLVEHGLFLGSEKYPEPEYLESFILMNGGRSTTAYTHSEFTTYVLVVGKEDTEEGLGILTDALTNPIMDETRIEHEVELIESEMLERKLLELCRYIWFLQTILASPSHPLHNFTNGCKATMNMKNLGERARRWVKTNFVGNNMILSMKGPLPMDKLVEIAVKYGSTVSSCSCHDPPRTKLGKKFADQVPFKPQTWNSLYYMDPYVEDDKFIRLSWLLPKEAAHNIKSKPIKFLMFLFTSRVPGSIDNYLRSKGWIFDMSSWSDNDYLQNRFSPIFQLNLELTAKGVQEKRDVVKAVFSYIKMLEASSIQDLTEVFNDLKKNNADYFHYKADYNVEDRSNTYNIDDEEFIKELGANIMNGVDPAETITSVYITKEFEEDLFRRCVKALNAENMNVIIGAKEFAERTATGVNDNPLKFKYCQCFINVDFITSVKSIRPYKEFKLPGHNKFVFRENICHPPPPGDKLKKGDNVVAIEDDRMFIMYSGACKSGLLPTAEYDVRLESPLADDWAQPTTVSIIPLMNVWIRCLMYTLNLKLSPLYDSLVTYDVKHNNPCLQITLKGPSHRLPEILHIILDTAMEHCCPRTFALVKAAARLYCEKYTFDSMDYGSDMLACFMEQKHVLVSERLQYLEDVHYIGYQHFLQDFKESLFVHVNISGCVTKKDVDEVIQTVKAMKYTSWERHVDDLKPVKCIMLPRGERCLRIKAANPNEECGLVVNYYQIGQVIFEDLDQMVDMLQLCLNTKAYQYLRTKHLLGYTVQVLKEDYSHITGISICVGGIQGSQFTTCYVDEMIDAFLQTFWRDVVQDRKEFDKYIGEGKNYGEDWTWKDLSEFYRIHILPNGPLFRKVSLQITPMKVNPKSKPKRGRFVNQKVKMYDTGISIEDDDDDDDDEQDEPAYKLDYPSHIKTTNGYFITDLERFKEGCMCYNRELNVDNFEEDLEDYADGDLK